MIAHSGTELGHSTTVPNWGICKLDPDFDPDFAEIHKYSHVLNKGKKSREDPAPNHGITRPCASPPQNAS